eukprot:54105_1
MAQDLSGPSWFERVFSIKGVLSLLCLMIVVFCVVGFARTGHVWLNIASASVTTLYGDSGILFKGLPGGSTHFIQLAYDGSVKPQNINCADLPNQKELFRSKAEIDGWSGAPKFNDLEENAASRQHIRFGIWTCTITDGNTAVAWYPMWNKIRYMEHPRLLGRDSNTKLTLRYMPSNHGPVFLTTVNSNSPGDLVDWKLPLTTESDDTGNYAYVVKSLCDSSDHFDSIVTAVRFRTSIFALSKWDGSEQFPIRVDDEAYYMYLTLRR